MPKEDSKKTEKTAKTGKITKKRVGIFGGVSLVLGVIAYVVFKK